MFLLTVFEFSEKTVLKDSGSIDVSVCCISSHKIIPNILIIPIINMIIIDIIIVANLFFIINLLVYLSLCLIISFFYFLN